MWPLLEIGQRISGSFSVFGDNMCAFGAERMKNMNELQIEAGENAQKPSKPQSVTMGNILNASFPLGFSQLFLAPPSPRK